MTQADVRSIPRAGTAHRSGCLPVPCRIKEWELVELVAEGTLARIFRARAAGSPADRPAPYALKILRPEWEDDPRAVGLLRREAWVGRTVMHPHLVSVLSCSVSRPPHFVVMPWLSGLTLEVHLASGRRLDLPVALWTARQVAEALDALSAAGWMQGDVKPSNVLISPHGHVTLLDLSFARRTPETNSVVDRCVMGTFNYLAPEMISSALRADIRSDIYSLGAMLFEMLSGRLPYEGADLAELATQHKQAPAPDLRRLVPHLPNGVVHLVRQMLAKQPLRRPHTPRELVERLVRLEIETFAERAPG